MTFVRPRTVALFVATVVSASCLATSRPAHATGSIATPAPAGTTSTTSTTPTNAVTGAAPLSTPDRLTGGAASLEEALALFLEAVKRNDRDALEGLRVTEAEWRSLIVPGSVAPGQAPQVLSEEGLDYFWGEMNQKSAAHRDAILERFGGKPFTPVRHSFEKGIREFAGYKAYGRLSVILRDEKGVEVELRTGSIVERDGRFKFATYIRD